MRNYEYDGVNHLPPMFSETATGSGVAVSTDGIQWYTIWNLRRFDGSVAIDLDAAFADAGLVYGSDVRIRFAHDEYRGSFSIDNVRVLTGSTTVSLASGTSSVPEDSGTITLQIVRSGDLTGQGSVRVITPASPPTDFAQPGTDFVPIDEEVTFLPGEDIQTVDLDIIDDGQNEIAEPMMLVLLEAEGMVALGPMDVVILDNDDLLPPQVASGTPYVEAFSGPGLPWAAEGWHYEGVYPTLDGGVFRQYYDTYDRNVANLTVHRASPGPVFLNLKTRFSSTNRPAISLEGTDGEFHYIGPGTYHPVGEGWQTESFNISAALGGPT